MKLEKVKVDQVNRGFLMNRVIKLFLLVAVSAPLIIKAQDVVVSFTTNLYTESPIKKVNSLVMKLWSHVDASLVHEEHYRKFTSMQKEFAKEVLLLNSLLDNALMVIEHQAYDYPESAEYAAHDLEHVLKVLYSLDQKYQELMYDQKSDEIIMVNYLLTTIINKVKEVTESGRVITPLHAFISDKSNYDLLNSTVIV